MELDEDGLTFNPSLEMGDEDGFLSLIEGLINDLYNVARLIPRLAKGRVNYKVSLDLLLAFGISLLGRQPNVGLALQSMMMTVQKVIVCGCYSLGFPGPKTLFLSFSLSPPPQSALPNVLFSGACLALLLPHVLGQS